jgi:hypothetical protein
MKEYLMPILLRQKYIEEPKNSLIRSKRKGRINLGHYLMKEPLLGQIKKN